MNLERPAIVTSAIWVNVLPGDGTTLATDPAVMGGLTFSKS